MLKIAIRSATCALTICGFALTGFADDAVDRSERSKKVLAGVRFSHPRDISNPYLPLGTLKQDVLEGAEGKTKIRITRTAKPDLRKTFTINGQTVEALVVEDREYEDGELKEVALDYFAQDDHGTVYYLGEDVDEYENGKIVGHSGAWLFGKDTPAPGIIFPAMPKIGERFMLEDVSAEITEHDEVVSLSETVVTPARKFEDCVKIKETLADGVIEFKYYSQGVGVVREAPPDGNVLLRSHEKRTIK